MHFDLRPSVCRIDPIKKNKHIFISFKIPFWIYFKSMKQDREGPCLFVFHVDGLNWGLVSFLCVPMRRRRSACWLLLTQSRPCFQKLKDTLYQVELGAGVRLAGGNWPEPVQHPGPPLGQRGSDSAVSHASRPGEGKHARAHTHSMLV